LGGGIFVWAFDGPLVFLKVADEYRSRSFTLLANTIRRLDVFCALKNVKKNDILQILLDDFLDKHAADIPEELIVVERVGLEAKIDKARIFENYKRVTEGLEDLTEGLDEDS
jgi:hypothetical protein